MNTGFQNSQIKILAILTRLRQICCDPSLFLENYDNESGKLELLMEILQDNISAGHRILLFSQFTEMLNIIEEKLKRKAVEYFRIDGSVKAENRMDMVNRFNLRRKRGISNFFKSRRSRPELNRSRYGNTL